MSNLLFKITLLSYLAASCGYLVYIASGRCTAEKIGRWLIRGSFILHCATLALRFISVTVWRCWVPSFPPWPSY